MLPFKKKNSSHVIIFCWPFPIMLVLSSSSILVFFNFSRNFLLTHSPDDNALVAGFLFLIFSSHVGIFYWPFPTMQARKFFFFEGSFEAFF